MRGNVIVDEFQRIRQKDYEKDKGKGIKDKQDTLKAKGKGIKDKQDTLKAKGGGIKDKLQPRTFRFGFCVSDDADKDSL